MNRKSIERLLLNLLLLIFILWILFPLYWLITTSIKPRLLAFQMPPVWIFKPTLENYIHVLQQGNFLDYFINSILLATGISIVTIFFATPAAYGLSRFQFKGKEILSTWILVVRMAPPIAFALAFYLWFKYLGLLNTFIGLIIAYQIVTLPLAIWILRAFFQGIPIELEEAAAIDGCSKAKALLLITLPLALPGISTTAILTFIIGWNGFLFVLILGGRDTLTLPVGIQFFIGFEGVNWGYLTAAGFITILPVMIFGVLIQKGFVKGLTAGYDK